MTTTKPSSGSGERFDLLAKQKGWTPEMLRQSYDLPKHPLPPGVPVIRLPAELCEDPFKNTPPVNAEEEFQTAETQFYNRLKIAKSFDKGAQSRTRSSPRSGSCASKGPKK